MGPGKARRFLLRGESYCRFGLPDYVEFNGVRQDVGKFLTTHALSSASNKAHQHSRVNHTILDNKDGRYAWRPMDLIHPALYVDLVHLITAHIADPVRAFQYAQLGRLAPPRAPIDLDAKLRPDLEAARKTTIPILIVTGPHDWIFPPEMMRMLDAELPASRLVEIPDAGHSPYFATPRTSSFRRPGTGWCWNISEVDAWLGASHRALRLRPTA